MLYALERIGQILDEPQILSTRGPCPRRAQQPRRDRRGRGAARHFAALLYRIDENGLIVWANLIIATDHNNLAMNRGVLQVARHFVDGAAPGGDAQPRRGGHPGLRSVPELLDARQARCRSESSLYGADGAVLDEMVRGANDAQHTARHRLREPVAVRTTVSAGIVAQRSEVSLPGIDSAMLSFLRSISSRRTGRADQPRTVVIFVAMRARATVRGTSIAASSPRWGRIAGVQPRRRSAFPLHMARLQLGTDGRRHLCRWGRLRVRHGLSTVVQAAVPQVIQRIRDVLVEGIVASCAPAAAGPAFM